VFREFWVMERSAHRAVNLQYAVSAANRHIRDERGRNMSNASLHDSEARRAIVKNKGKMSLRAFARSIGVNAGYLSAVLNGTRPASNKLRVKLGLPPHTVEVYPLPCGCAPTGTRCKVHQPAPKYAPHPVMRITKIKRILNSPYKDS